MKYITAILILLSSPIISFADPTEPAASDQKETSTQASNGVIVNGDGSMLIIDNVKYEVHPDDKKTAAGWLDSPGPFRVSHVDNGSDAYDYEIKNLNLNNETVRARKAAVTQ